MNQTTRIQIFGTLAFLVAAAFVFPAHYTLGSNSVFGGTDSVRMTAIAQGVGLDGPSEQLFYSHQLLGHLCAILNSINPRIGWYGVILLLAIGFAVYLAIGICLRNSKLGLAGLVPVLVYLLHFWTRLQFTTSAVAIAAAGTWVIIEAVGTGSPPRKRRVLAGLAAIWVGTMIRPQSAYLVLIVLGIPSMAACWRGSKRSGILVFLIALSGVAILRWSHGQLMDDEWKAFRQRHDSMAKILNNRRIRKTILRAESKDDLPPDFQETLADADWSLSRAQLFLLWFAPRELHSSEAISQLEPLTQYSVNTGNLVDVCHTIEIVAQDLGFWLLFFAATPMVVREGRVYSIAALTGLVAAIVLMTLVQLYLKLPPHVYRSILYLCYLATCSMIFQRPGKEFLKPRLSRVCIFGMLVIGSMIVIGSYKHAAHAARLSNIYREEITSSLDAEGVYFVFLPYPFNLERPSGPLESEGYQILYHDGFQESPHYRHRAAGYGLSRKSIVQSLCSDQRVRILAMPRYIRCLNEVLLEEGYEVQFRIERKLRWVGLYRAHRLRRANAD